MALCRVKRFPGAAHASLMPAIFFGHGNPMNALPRNSYTEQWTAIGARLLRPKAILLYPPTSTFKTPDFLR
jgi:aromatic ring-opening dioxygenase catalytic subunit (LigB family)